MFSKWCSRTYGSRIYGCWLVARFVKCLEGKGLSDATRLILLIGGLVSFQIFFYSVLDALRLFISLWVGPRGVGVDLRRTCVLLTSAGMRISNDKREEEICRRLELHRFLLDEPLNIRDREVTVKDLSKGAIMDLMSMRTATDVVCLHTHYPSSEQSERTTGYG